MRKILRIIAVSFLMLGAQAAMAQALDNPLGTTDLRIAVGRLIKALLGISGILALVAYVYGGLMWMLSYGSEKRITQGKQAMVWASLGLAVMFGAYVIVNLLIQTLSSGVGV